MKGKRPSKQLERYRVTTGPLASRPADGYNGAFMVPGPSGVVLACIVSDARHWQQSGLPGQPFEHVSVSLQARCPTWEEMNFVKRLFWRDDETVIQYHVPRDRHVNVNEHCLHLWRPTQSKIPTPPIVCV